MPFAPRTTPGGPTQGAFREAPPIEIVRGRSATKSVIHSPKSSNLWNDAVHYAGPGQEIRFRLVVNGQRVRAFDAPVDLVVNMLEKVCAIAVL